MQYRECKTERHEACAGTSKEYRTEMSNVYEFMIFSLMRSRALSAPPDKYRMNFLLILFFGKNKFPWQIQCRIVFVRNGEWTVSVDSLPPASNDSLMIDNYIFSFDSCADPRNNDMRANQIWARFDSVDLIVHARAIPKKNTLFSKLFFFGCCWLDSLQKRMKPFRMVRFIVPVCNINIRSKSCSVANVSR